MTTLHYLKQIIQKNNLTDIINIKIDETQPGSIIITCKKNYNKKQIKEITQLLQPGVAYKIITK